MPTINSEIIGSVWKVEVEVGQRVEPGDTLMILESMKMEFPVEPTDPGTVTAIHCVEGDSVAEGDPLVTVE
jgi:acetyl-CoA carboxylase biotin carboxyl carrier protein